MWERDDTCLGDLRAELELRGGDGGSCLLVGQAGGVASLVLRAQLNTLTKGVTILLPIVDPVVVVVYLMVLRAGTGQEGEERGGGGGEGDGGVPQAGWRPHHGGEGGWVGGHHGRAGLEHRGQHLSARSPHTQPIFPTFS